MDFQSLICSTVETRFYVFFCQRGKIRKIGLYVKSNQILETVSKIGSQEKIRKIKIIRKIEIRKIEFRLYIHILKSVWFFSTFFMVSFWQKKKYSCQLSTAVWQPPAPGPGPDSGLLLLDLLAGPVGGPDWRRREPRRRVLPPEGEGGGRRPGEGEPAPFQDTSWQVSFEYNHKSCFSG